MPKPLVNLVLALSQASALVLLFISRVLLHTLPLHRCLPLSRHKYVTELLIAVEAAAQPMWKIYHPLHVQDLKLDFHLDLASDTFFLPGSIKRDGDNILYCSLNSVTVI